MREIAALCNAFAWCRPISMLAGAMDRRSIPCALALALVTLMMEPAPNSRAQDPSRIASTLETEEIVRRLKGYFETPVAYQYPEIESVQIDFELDDCRASHTVRIRAPQMCVTGDELVAHFSELNLRDLITDPARTMRGHGAGPGTTQIIWPLTEDAVEDAIAASERKLAIIRDEELRIAGTNVFDDITPEQFEEIDRAVNARIAAIELGGDWPNFHELGACDGMPGVLPMTSFWLVVYEADADEITALLDEYVRRTCRADSSGK